MLALSTFVIGAPILASVEVGRYHLPETPYFESLRRGMPLHTLAGYAHAERLAALVGTNLGTTFHVPMSGPHEYSPYGAGLVERIREDPQAVHTLTGKWERALVASPGTAVLGLGEVARMPDGTPHAEAADAIMQGKAKWFLATAGVRTDPICVRTQLRPEHVRELSTLEGRTRGERERIIRATLFAETVLAIARNYGFINIEDAQGKDLPIILGILEALKGECGVWSDDKMGTGIIAAAMMLAWTEQTGRRPDELRGVIMGAGAGAMGVYDEFLNHGVPEANIVTTDSQGVIHEGREDVFGDAYKRKMARGVRAGMTLEEALEGADFWANLGVKESLTRDRAWTERMTRRLAQNPLFAPMTNPDPGITPEELAAVRRDAFYASGNQTFPNTANNFTAFGQVGAGVLMAKAGGIGPGMTVAAARGILAVAKMGPPAALRDALPREQREFGRFWLVPRPDDIRLIELEAGAVAKAAAREGLAIMVGRDPSPLALRSFDAGIDEQVRARVALVKDLHRQAEKRGRVYLKRRHPKGFAPFSVVEGHKPAYYVPPQVDRTEFEGLAREMGVSETRWQDLIEADGTLSPKSLTIVLERLKPATEETVSSRGKELTPEAKIALQELELIVQIATIAPALGLAVALRRTRVRPENLTERPTVFHRRPVLEQVVRTIPNARKAIYTTFSGIPELT